MYFPLEIISAILSNQPKTELKEARLVCKAFDTAAIPFLFNEIFFIARYADMERATSLASHFGSHVKTLIFSSESFPQGTEAALNDFGSYGKLRNERDELLLGGEFFGSLCSILVVLSNLEKVILTNAHRTRRLCWCQQAYGGAHSRTFNPWSRDRYPKLRPLRPPPEHKCFTSDSGLDQWHSNPWPEILQALSISGNNRVKSIATEFFKSGLTVYAFCMTPRQMFCATKVLPNLTSLHLHLDFFGLDNDDGEQQIYTERVIARTLSVAINLKSLVIEVVEEDPGFDEKDGPTTFKSILEGCKMPRLSTFGLVNVCFMEASMTNFLQDSPEIRHLSLDEVRMISGSWEKILNTIKNTLHLKTFEPKALYGLEQELSQVGFDKTEHDQYLAIERFVLGDGPNPFSLRRSSKK